MWFYFEVCLLLVDVSDREVLLDWCFCEKSI